MSFHHRYLALVDDIERSFPVAEWKSGDVDVWPSVRMDLYADMYWLNAGTLRPPSRAFPLRLLGRLAMPARNLWRSRRDLAHWIARPRRADAIFLGDGISLDCVNGAWRDRFGEAVIAALEERGSSTFLMQSGPLRRLPWHRPTFAANLIEARAFLRAAGAARPAELPGHEAVLAFLARAGIESPSLSRVEIERRCAMIRAAAAAFERVLAIVQPKLAFVVTCYEGLGPAFMLACRRSGILSIDLQHCPQEGAHKAYGWSSLPDEGYRTLPAVFWNWSETDAAHIRGWASRLKDPWHRSLHGGHTQLEPFLDGQNSDTQRWDDEFRAHSRGAKFEREILVALQPIHGQRDTWRALAAQIARAPRTWRWWIRRHPASAGSQDVEFGPLLTGRAGNVEVEAASTMPLPALLRHMSVLISVASGAATEAASFGVPALFLSESARGPFNALIERRVATVVATEDVNDSIARISAVATRPPAARAPRLPDTLERLEQIADEYRSLYRNQLMTRREVPLPGP